MINHRFFREYRARLRAGAVWFACSCACLAEAGAPPGAAPVADVQDQVALDRYSQSPRWQVHSRPGAHFDTTLPGSTTSEESPIVEANDDIALTQRVDVNSASADELAAALPGIGPGKALNIIEWRELNGPFRSIEQLLEVSGIGPRTLENIRPFVRLGDSLSLQGSDARLPSAEAEIVAALSAIIRRADEDRRRALLSVGEDPG